MIAWGCNSNCPHDCSQWSFYNATASQFTYDQTLNVTCIPPSTTPGGVKYISRTKLLKKCIRKAVLKYVIEFSDAYRSTFQSTRMPDRKTTNAAPVQSTIPTTGNAASGKHDCWNFILPLVAFFFRA